MSVPSRELVHPLFGDPLLRCENNGEVAWVRNNSVSQLQKGTGVSANLYGGVQSGNDDWAALYLPIGQPLPLVNLTKDTMWSYLMTNAETMGVNLVLWVHDPTNWTKRAEITQLGNTALLGKAAGWNTHKLLSTTAQFFFYGENTDDSDLTAGVANLYTLDQFQADTMFKHWNIYRVSWEYGWDASGTFDDVWLSEVQFNGKHVHLYPGSRDDFGGEVKTLTQKTAGTSTTKQTMITPRATKRVRIISIALGNLGSTSSEIEVYFHTGANIDATVAKAIYTGTADADYASQSQSWAAKEGPLGAIGEVVSIRTAVDITTEGRVTITYREE